MRANRGIPRDLEGEGKSLNTGQSAFRRKGDVMVQVWKDKRLVRMISSIHERAEGIATEFFESETL
jgi:hypothetical protein